MPTVHILATCRNPELIRATTLVFDSLRTGFPTARVYVYCNGLGGYSALIQQAACKAGVPEFNLHVLSQTIHHDWIYKLFEKETEPFFICDTDLIFWSSFEDFDFSGAAMAGRYVPQFFDRFTNCITRPRLHTSLLYLDPQKIKQQVDAYFSQFPETPFNPRPNLIFPNFLPYRIEQAGHPERGKVKNFFHDTCSMLYQAIGGQAFTEAQLDCYDHLNFGTISDIVCPHYPDERWRESHFAIFENPQLAKGAWRAQEMWYKANAA